VRGQARAGGGLGRSGQGRRPGPRGRQRAPRACGLPDTPASSTARPAEGRRASWAEADGRSGRRRPWGGRGSPRGRPGPGSLASRVRGSPEGPPHTRPGSPTRPGEGVASAEVGGQNSADPAAGLPAAAQVEGVVRIGRVDGVVAGSHEATSRSWATRAAFSISSRARTKSPRAAASDARRAQASRKDGTEEGSGRPAARLGGSPSSSPSESGSEPAHGAPVGRETGTGEAKPAASPIFRTLLRASMVGATGFEPATTCTPTAAGTLAPGLTEAHAVVSRVFTGTAPRSTSHVGAPGSTLRMACTAPALRSSDLPAPEPALFLTAGGIVAQFSPTQETVILARAALQAALADALLVRAESAGTAIVTGPNRGA